MDRPEIIANKGYETFGEHFFNKGVADTISVLKDMGMPAEKIAEVHARLDAKKSQ